MARKPEPMTFSGALEVQAQKPLDGRRKVTLIADLTNAASFPYIYKGLDVFCEENEKWYTFLGGDQTDITNWREEGSGGGGDEHVELTQAEYDALTYEEKHNGKVYFITDGEVPSGDFVKYLGDATDASLNANVAANVLQIIADYAETDGYKAMAFNFGEKEIRRYKKKADNSWEQTGRWTADEDTGWKNDKAGFMYRVKNGLLFVSFRDFTAPENITANTAYTLDTLPQGYKPAARVLGIIFSGNAYLNVSVEVDGSVKINFKNDLAAGALAPLRGQLITIM